MLIVMSNPEPVDDEATIINELFDAGMELLHLRKIDVTADAMKKLLMKIRPEHYSKIAIHQHHQLAEDFGIIRFHFTETKRRMLKEDELKKIKKMGNRLSTSMHSMKDYKNLSADFDYSFFGPVFNSISKKGYGAVVKNSFNLTGIKNKTNIIAIGGVNEENVNKAFEMGFDGVAVLGAIWQVSIAAVKNYKKIMNRCKIIGQ